MRHESTVAIEAEGYPGVRLRIRRPTYAGRLELLKQVQELSRRLDFHRAGESAQSAIDAAVVEKELELAYLRWGLVELEGLVVDGTPADVELAIARGPELLLRQALDAIKKQLGLTEDERKN